jgi:hypothetical protein
VSALIPALFMGFLLIVVIAVVLGWLRARAAP